MIINNIEEKLKSILPFFFTFVFITTIVIAFNNYFAHATYSIGDWLINYSGGFVRRGFFGEIASELSNILHFNPGIIITFVQIGFYFIFLLFSYLLIKRQSYIFPYFLFIFSPFIFLFQLNDQGGGFRKEIIFFALIAFFSWSLTKKREFYQKIYYAILLIYPLVILSHEMLAIFLPYIVILYLIKEDLNKKDIFISAILLLLSVFSLLLAMKFPGNELIIKTIHSSLQAMNYDVQEGAIEWLNKDISYGYALSQKKMIHNGAYIQYFFILSFALIPYFMMRQTLFKIFSNKLILVLFISILSGTVILSLIAIDWGRFFYINLIGMFFMIITFNNIHQSMLTQYNNNFQAIKINKKVIAFLIFYIFLWHIPHVGSPRKAIKTNIVQVTFRAYSTFFKYLKN